MEGERKANGCTGELSLNKDSRKGVRKREGQTRKEQEGRKEQQDLLATVCRSATKAACIVLSFCFLLFSVMICP